MSPKEIFVRLKSIASSFLVVESQNITQQHTETDVTQVMMEAWMICPIVWLKTGPRILVKSKVISTLP